jgi:oligopeptide/dipeptide ABC transporter ATP-binding protein
MTAAQAALSVDALRVELVSGDAVIEDVSLQVAPGEILGLVGESGSGKTTTALALLGYARPGVRIVHGEIGIAGEEVGLADEARARQLRGRLVSYVPQDPGTSLNPALRIGRAIQDMLDEHAADREVGSVESALTGVHLPATEEFVRRYPHQLSGGQQQRVTIAISLVCEPPLVVLDEPTTGLDVVTQARVLEEVDRLRRERGLAMVYVSHDLAVVAQIADRIAVMYAGRIVEEGPAAAVLAEPKHPYTRGLIASIPDHVTPRRPRGMPGIAVGVGEHPVGCAFAPRCSQRWTAARPSCPSSRRSPTRAVPAASSGAEPPPSSRPSARWVAQRHERPRRARLCSRSRGCGPSTARASARSLRPTMSHSRCPVASASRSSASPAAARRRSHAASRACIPLRPGGSSSTAWSWQGRRGSVSESSGAVSRSSSRIRTTP